MNPEPSMLPERDERLGEILADWIEAAERGQAPDSAEWLARHADFAVELQEFLANRARLQDAAQTLCQAVRATGMIGRSVGEHDLLEEIGQGGMGLVYRARHRRLQRTVALKMLRANVLSAVGDAQRFRNEAEVLAQLDHPHIVPVHDVGEHEGRVYFSMKLIEGGGLDGQLTRFTNDPRAAARLMAQVARAVHHAHQRGILHRDLKPSNILLDRDGQPHVSDFGLAKRMQADGNLTQTGAIVGTPQYMAPEQTSGRKGAVTTATDVYGLGAVLYALLTGKPPFQGETVLETLEQVREREPEPPHRIVAKVDRDLETICLKCLQKEPQRRYESAQALAEDLERWLGGKPIRARRRGVLESLWIWVRLRPARAALVLVSVVSILGYVGGLMWYNLRLQESAWREHLQAEEVTRQRDLAREQRRLARAAVDKMYSEVAEKWLTNQPDLQRLQVQFLEDALYFYQDFASETASDPDSRAEKGRAYYRVAMISWELGQRFPALESYAHAIATFQGLIEEFPENPEYSYQLGQCYLRRAVCRGPGALEQEIEDGRQAIALFEPLASRFPANPRFPEALAKSLNNLSNPVSHFDPAQAEELRSRSVVLFENLLKDFGPRGETLRGLAAASGGLGESRMAAGKLSEAEVDFRKAIETFHRLQINPSRGQVYGHHLTPYDWLNLGSCYRTLGNDLSRRSRFVEAQEALKQGLKIHAKLAEDFPDLVIYRPDIGMDHRVLGELYHRMGQASEADKAYQLAKKELERMVQDFPTGWAFHYNLARFLVSCPQRDYRDAPLAIRLARKAIEAIPEDVHLWHVLGIGYFQLGEHRAALEALRKAKDLRVRGNSFDFYYLAMVQHQLGDRQGAYQSYQEAVEWMSKNRPGDEELSRLRVEAASLLGIKDRQTKKKEIASEKK